MAKFRIKLKLQGLDLEIEGSREDAPLIAQNLSQQFAGLIRPAVEIISAEADGEDKRENKSPATIESDTVSEVRKKRKKRNPTAATPSADGVDDAALDWRHDPSKWGTPKQAWNTANKAIWLLYVASNETPQKEMSAKRIEATFNKHFKQAGQIKNFNITRDLGKQKLGKDAPVSEDTTQTPPPWFLTENGNKRAQRLVAEALGRTDSGDGA